MIGRKLRNRYEITEHLGDGSTATVYKATDSRLGREVALKILLPHVRESSRKRFFQEATAAAQLNHPNIMAIHDVDEDNDQYFLVVEYVEGQSLANFIPSPPDVVVELGQQIARALSYAHQRQIIHRDIKPANIQVTPSGQVKIMDLGLALPREAKRVTADGMIIGTPAYLSPEQAQGHELDLRTDIYSLGVVLYELATGQLPFDNDDIPALLLQQVKQPPPPPRLINPELPVALENVILKALEKKPARRFQNCDALAAALEAVMRPGFAPDAPTQPAKPFGTDALMQRLASHQAQQARSKVLRLVVADDHTLLRKMLVDFLEGHDEFVIIGEASNGDEAYEKVVSLTPDVLMLDLNMPGKGGLDILPQVRAKMPQVKVLVLTGRDEDWYIMQALRAGAHGYILKSSSEGDLIDAINKVAQGDLVLGQGVVEKVVTAGLMGGHNEQSGRINDEERQVLLYVAAGYDNGAIAGRMGLSVAKVIELLASILDKLGAGDRNAAALLAIKQGYVLIEELHEVPSVN